MALSLQDVNIVKGKVFRYLQSGLKGDSQARETFKAFFSNLSQHGVNPDLQFVSFANLTADTVIADAACKVYAIYLKKQNTATAAYFKADDSATVTSGTADMLVQELNAAKDVAELIYRKGWAQASGLTIASDTTANGTTTSTSGDGPDGFCIIGAA